MRRKRTQRYWPERTVGWWYEQLDNNSIKEAAFRNTSPTLLSAILNSAYDAVDFGMTWDETPEGQEFWDEVHSALMHQHDLPDYPIHLRRNAQNAQT